MIVLSATAIFWFIAIGSVIGALFGFIVKEEGVSIPTNIFWGIFASVLTGTIAILMEFGDGLFIAAMYTLAFLFLVNVFHHHHKEDVEGDIKQSIRIIKK